MTEGRVAKRYAKALFNAALKQNIVASVDDDLAVIASSLNNSAKFKAFLLQPQTTDEQKEQVFTKTFSDKVTALTMSFIRLLVDKRRDDQITAIQLAFAELRREHENTSKAIVTTAEELSDQERKKVVTTIESKLGRKVMPEFVVDPKIMGGITVAYDDYVLDGSVRGKLDRLRERMLYDLLKQA